MRCIYCREPTSGREGEAHIFPEGLRENDVVLPPGAVCDKCNNYFGATLDSTLVQHPVISLAVQFLGLPGKGGRIRSELGGVERDPNGTYIHVPIEEPEVEVRPNGGREVTFSPRVSPRFDSLEFGREIYHIAFNSFAKGVGVEEALQEKFDPVRKYIRKPDREEKWPYAVRAEPLRRIRPLLGADGIAQGPGSIVLVQIFNLDFYVDLLGTEDFPDWIETELPQDVDFGFPMVEPEEPGDKLHRATIYLDDR